jgi:hypothetical protein
MMNLALAKLLKKMKIPLEAAGGHTQKLNRAFEASAKVGEGLSSQTLMQKAFDSGLLKTAPDSKRTAALVDRASSLRKIERKLQDGTKKTRKGITYGINAAGYGTIPLAAIYLALKGDDE